MKDFILGLVAKVVTLIVITAVCGLACLTFYVLAYAFDFNAIGLVILVIIIAVVWQVFERIREGKEDE
jgi:apolipoprotein N-acyltransferase